MILKIYIPKNGAMPYAKKERQIGIDVLPPYRKKGIAAALTSQLALLILEQGKVPFYCAAWSNIKSVRNAIKCGFKPAWVEMTAKSCKFSDEMNQRFFHTFFLHALLS